MAWIFDNKEDAVILTEVEGASDRAAAIVAASYLEERLTETLRAALEQDEDVSNRMFRGYGPLATFSAKIELAHLMGLIAPQTRREITIIKNIRNEFAHLPHERNFHSQRIRDLCGNLADRYSKGKYWISIDKLKGIKSEHIPKRLKEGLYAGPDTPRSRYLAAVQQCLIQLALKKWIVELARCTVMLDDDAKYWPWSSPEKSKQRVPQARRTVRQKPKKRKRLPLSSSA